MSYQVKEIFYTLQGEGRNAGRAAVFCRFAGCNLWSGREADRATAVCKFCDTDFVGTDGTLGGSYTTADALAQTMAQTWRGSGRNDSAQQRFAVLTGGEPLLQVDARLIDALHAQGFRIAVETNGTIEAPAGLDWICVSPKAGATLAQRTGHELKVVMPQAGIDMNALAQLRFDHYYVQAMDSSDPVAKRESQQWVVDWCMTHPQWVLSVQTHKVIGIR